MAFAAGAGWRWGGEGHHYSQGVDVRATTVVMFPMYILVVPSILSTTASAGKAAYFALSFFASRPIPRAFFVVIGNGMVSYEYRS